MDDDLTNQPSKAVDSDELLSLGEFSSADSYLFLIDDELKTTIEGQLCVCTNPNHDLWQPFASLTVETLKKIAVKCVIARSQRFSRPALAPLLAQLKP